MRRSTISCCGVAVLAAFALLALGGCGGSEKPAYCSDQEALQQSVADLRGVDLTGGGLSQLRARLAAVEDDATALIASARDQFAPQSAQLRSALDRLRTAVGSATSTPSASAVSDVVTDASAVASAVGDFADAVRSSC